MNEMNEMNEIKLPKGVNRIAVKQHDDKIVIEFIPEEPKFKRGDILISIVTPGLTVIFDKMTSTTEFDSIYNNGEVSNHDWRLKSFRHATEEEKQEFFDELKADVKRWNAEKLIVEDIPQPVEDIPQPVEDIPRPKFKIGDKVRIKKGVTISSFMCDGLTLTVSGYATQGQNILYCKGFSNLFHEDWLEFYSEEPKEGDLAIFWDDAASYAIIKIYGRKYNEYHYDSSDCIWNNAIKFESKEQFEKILRGEIN